MLLDKHATVTFSFCLSCKARTAIRWFICIINLNTFGQDTGTNRGYFWRVQNLFSIYLKHIPTVISVQWDNTIQQTNLQSEHCHEDICISCIKINNVFITYDKVLPDCLHAIGIRNGYCGAEVSWLWILEEYCAMVWQSHPVAQVTLSKSWWNLCTESSTQHSFTEYTAEK